MMKTIKILICLSLTICFVSCEIVDFGEELQTSPNSLNANSADPNFLLNNIQKETADLLMDLNRTTDEVMRYTYLNETYADVANPSSLNTEYINYYAFLEDAKILYAQAENNEDLRFHRGMAIVLTSFATVTMVDYLGNIPFTEANKTKEGILNPVADDDQSIYTSLLEQIDSAINDFNSGTLAPTNDLYYSGDRDKWIRLANSLKFKMYLHLEDVSALNTLISEDNLISEADEFEFKYGTNVAEPDSRHPDYNIGYRVGGYTSFLGNSFLNLLLNGKSMQDPRTRYYVYRQSLTDPSDVLLGCVNQPAFDFCYLGNGYYGRDHGDIRSIGADRQFRATYGLYPVGGAFDEDMPFTEAINAPNEGGAGILPIFLASYMDFLRAEAALRFNTNDDAITLLESGIRKSMTKVLNFRGVAQGSSFAASQTDVDNYVSEVQSNYASASAEGKLDIVLEEFYLASYGNSTESYNGYRRTGYPSSLQTPIFNENIPFPRLFSYPNDVVNFNNNINQQSITTQVFWDTNPAGFIN